MIKLNFLIILLCLKSYYFKNFLTFQEYVQKFNKTYLLTELKIREQIYYENLKYIERMSCQACGVNNFTDWTYGQMKKIKGIHENIKYYQILQSVSSINFTKTEKDPDFKNPLKFDWRDKNAITPVRNQFACGGCWAFSTTAFIQSDLIISQNYTNKLDLSEEYLLNCQNRSLGCIGGFSLWAMSKVLSDGGMPLETQYPFDYKQPHQIKQGMCFETQIIKISNNRKMVSYFNVENEKFIQNLILKKPLNINICSADMQYYSPTNQYRTLKCNPLNTIRDHSVLLIGYTQTEWIIKNQWGTQWGIDGYGYISRNNAQECCIGTQIFTTGLQSQTCLIQNCQICVELNSCSKCFSKYYVTNKNSSHSCQKCLVQNCFECINYYGICSQCNQGYTVAYPFYICQKQTVKYCKFMFFDKCNECRQGYGLIKQLNKCLKLQEIIGSKNKIVVGEFRLLCENGTYYEKATNSCQLCVYPCLECNQTPYQCTKCVPKYEIQNNSNKCIPCMSLISCIGCVQGYFVTKLNNISSFQVCRKCSSSCLTCMYNSQYCLSCPINYYLTKNRKCIKMSKKYKIQYQITLDSKYNQQNISSLVNYLQTVIKVSLKLNQKQNVKLLSVKQGSIYFKFMIQVPQYIDNVIIENSLSCINININRNQYNKNDQQFLPYSIYQLNKMNNPLSKFNEKYNNKIIYSSLSIPISNTSSQNQIDPWIKIGASIIAGIILISLGLVAIFIVRRQRIIMHQNEKKKNQQMLRQNQLNKRMKRINAIRKYQHKVEQNINRQKNLQNIIKGSISEQKQQDQYNR